MRSRTSLIKYIAIALIVVTVVAMPFVAIFRYAGKTTEADYTLSTIEDGIYGIYHTVSSSIPANNYEVITVCADGCIMTVEGHVYIYYDAIKPTMHLIDKNIVYGDEVHIHVPKGTIRINPGVGLR